MYSMPERDTSDEDKGTTYASSRDSTPFDRIVVDIVGPLPLPERKMHSFELYWR